jgi:hypothetical protein
LIGGGFVEAFYVGFLGGSGGSRRSAAAARFSGVFGCRVSGRRRRIKEIGSGGEVFWGFWLCCEAAAAGERFTGGGGSLDVLFLRRLGLGRGRL